MTKSTENSFYYKARRDIISTILWVIIGVVFFFILKGICNCVIRKELEAGYNVQADRQLLSIVLKMYIGFILFYILCSAITIFVRTHSKLTINQNEIIYRTGWLTKRTITIPANKIRTCAKSCGPLQMICETQTVSITTAGDQAEITFANIENGEEAFNRISKLSKAIPVKI